MLGRRGHAAMGTNAHSTLLDRPMKRFRYDLADPRAATRRCSPGGASTGEVGSTRSARGLRLDSVAQRICHLEDGWWISS